MATKRWILFLLPAAMISVLAGCGGSTYNVQNPPPPPPTNVSIAFQPEPASAINVGFSENVTAVVTNDPQNYGVDWSLSCQNPPNCGTLSALHTASGVATTYAAPASISSNNMTVEIVAYATASHTQNVVAPITVSTFDSLFAAGTYVLQAQGTQNGLPYQFAGALVFDGKGNITNGEQTANYSLVSVTDQNLTGNYFIGNDGRGTITINTNDSSIGVETFALVYLSSTQALISQMDFGNANTGASATGTLDLQTSMMPPSGSYAFVLGGTDVVDSMPMAYGGVFDITSGQNTITGVLDEILEIRVKLSDSALGAGSELSSGPDAFGKVTFTLAGLSDGVHPKPVSAVLTGYLVDEAHIKLIESDTAAGGSVPPLAATGGLALGQASGSYGNFDNGSFDGTFVFGVTGMDLYPVSTYIPSTWTSAGIFTADGGGNLTQGFSDTFLQENCVQTTCKKGMIVGAQVSSSLTGTYSVDSGGTDPGSGTGRMTLNSFTFSPAPNPSYNPTLFVYLTGNQGQGPTALILAAGDLGTSPRLHYASIGTGVAYAQSTATPAFSGPFGFSFTQVNSSGENDGTAQLNADPTTTPASLSGAADVNFELGANLDQAFTGTFSAPTAPDPFAGTLAGTNNNVVSSVAFTPPMGVDYYFIDPGHGFFVETDLVSPSPGSGQVSFGFYGERSPVCPGCP